MQSKQVVTYSFSAEVLQEVKRQLLFWQLFLPVILTITIFASPLADTRFLIKLLALTVSLLLLEGILLLQSRLMLERVKESTLTLTETAIEKADKRLRETISYAEVTRLDIVEKASGAIANIKVQSATKALNIYGFERLHEIVQMITQNVSEQTPLHRKRQTADWTNRPLQAVVGLATVGAILLIQRVSQNAYYVFNTLLLLATGLFTLTVKPISTSWGTRFAKIELGLGVLMILCATIMTILLLYLE